MTDMTNARGMMMRPRPDWEDPHDRRCALHLRRCCGACAHFSGKVIRQKGDCRVLGRTGISGARVPECEHWTRKTEGS